MAKRRADAPGASLRLTASGLGEPTRLDRFLPVWIGFAMVAGLLLGRWVPGIADVLDAITVGSVSLPIALGLLVMMYPVLAKVRYDEIGDVTRDRRTLVLSPRMTREPDGSPESTSGSSISPSV